MPRNFSELKSGGVIPMLSPHPDKWGDTSPRPPPIDARDYTTILYTAHRHVSPPRCKLLCEKDTNSGATFRSTRNVELVQKTVAPQTGDYIINSGGDRTLSAGSECRRAFIKLTYKALTPDRSILIDILVYPY